MAISVTEMRALEDKAEAGGISKLDLMENAGLKLAEVIESKFKIKDKRVLFVCYHGNNGGDGFVAARLLAHKTEVEVLFLGEESKLKPEAKENFNRLKENVLVQFISLDFINFNDYAVIVDAILGMGIEGELKPLFQSTIELMNKSKAKKVSVDIPTGLNPDTGKEYGISFNADIIVSFHDIKKGLTKLKDKVEVVDIGIPKEF